MTKTFDEEFLNLLMKCQSGKMTCRKASDLIERIFEKRSPWIQGEPPLETTVLLRNRKQIFGPISFHRKGDLELFMDHNLDDGYLTHYMVIPKCE
jgi:hypothetical protein